MPARKSSSMFALALATISLIAVAAYAGAPLKGVDVKLGKSPGGGASARTTDAEGKLDLGVLPAGSYYLMISAPKGTDVTRDPEAQIEIKGATGGTIKKRWDYAKKKAFDAAPADSSARVAAPIGEEKIIFTSDGSHPVVITASTNSAILKSKSNISNN
ncbi:MAG TPA: carboxypeptidase-like regulatory domain-containing protein [Thermoanaerobaculia bacterium]|nr:carboxypeptidase-like regulatory domain-containing protein [Thermoanaerobaculia bacterium]